MGVVVAVDGSAGSGKSSVSRGVAQTLGLRYVDTGAMYRAMTLWMLDHGVAVDQPDAVAAHADEATIEVGTDPTKPTISLDGVDVSEAIRTPEVTAAVSSVSAVPQIRQRLVQIQRAAADGSAGGVIVEGRDIGSVVLPHADVKIFLVADQEVRAARRAAEDAARGHGGDVDATAEALARRDHADSSRAASPLAKADDAIVIDATYDDLPTVIGVVTAVIEAAT